MRTLITAICALTALCSALNAADVLRSPDGNIEVAFQSEKGSLRYAVKLNGNEIIRPSSLGLKAKADDTLKVIETSRSTFDETWKPVWGIHSSIRNHYNEIQLKLGDVAEQTVVFRAYDDGIAFRYEIPKAKKFDSSYAYEVTQVNFISEQPKAWFPISQVILSNETDLNTWKPAKEGQKLPDKNVPYDFKPDNIRTPFLVKLSDQAYISVHEAAIVHSAVADVKLEGNTLTYNSKIPGSGGKVTSWRTIHIAERPTTLIESSLLVNLNEPCKIEDTSWIKPGVTMWDWRNHGAVADDGFEYHIDTASYIRYIDFAAEAGVEYLLIDAEWYGRESSPKSDPKTAIPSVDIEKVCAHAKEQGIGIWLYLNTRGLEAWDIDTTFTQLKEWGVVGIKQGFGIADRQRSIQFDLNVVKKCAEHELMYIRHESAKPSGVNRTYPNILSYEYLNSMLDAAIRPPATPTRLINGLFVFGITGPLDRSCGMFDLDSYISREKCHRQLPSTVVSQAAQCLLYPTGLLTLPDFPDAYRRKADFFEWIAQLPMNWDRTIALEAEIGHYITVARQAGDAWFVGALANEAGRETSVTLDFLEEGVTYELTLYEDAPNAHYEYIGPMHKLAARAQKVKLVPQETRRELYQIKKITAKKGDTIPVVIAPGGGHCMWIRPLVVK
ncbi:glycoside hydrolase family 97 protein [Lentimonas sp. CC10]|nr:glycoside hydrolase family 97 protein [Lentimonas sp. CC10]